MSYYFCLHWPSFTAFSTPELHLAYQPKGHFASTMYDVVNSKDGARSQSSVCSSMPRLKLTFVSVAVGQAQRPFRNVLPPIVMQGPMIYGSETQVLHFHTKSCVTSAWRLSLHLLQALPILRKPVEAFYSLSTFALLSLLLCVATFPGKLDVVRD